MGERISNKLNFNLEYGELAKDEEFVNKCENLNKYLMNVQKVLDKLLPLKANHYDKMSLEAQVEVDLFLVFALNSLYWIKLRIQGVDLTDHPINGELQRVKATMLRWQEVKNYEKRPTVNVEAANRFVRNSLYDPSKGNTKQQNKKIVFDD